MQVLDGRYGPYVKYGKVNATIPKEMDPAQVTLEQALEMIATEGGEQEGQAQDVFKEGREEDVAAIAGQGLSAGGLHLAD